MREACNRVRRQGRAMGDRRVAVAGVLAMVVALGLVRAAEQEKGDALEAQRCPRPAEFASVFSFGYAGDSMPKDDARFEALLAKLKGAGFNTVHCVHSDGRLALCKKHGVRMMVDLLAPEHHVYKGVEAAKALCEKLRGRPEAWGYAIWHDNIGKTYDGRKRDIANVRTWDPTHPAFCGTYRTYGMSHLTNADVMGYYDYHWKRGREQHFPHLLAYTKWAAERNACFYRWVATDSGIPGKGNHNRSLYTANTSIACGLKGILWFLGTTLVNPNSLEWTAAGGDIAKVNKEVMPLSEKIGMLGNPVAIYSTPITKTANNDALPDGKASMMPQGLERNAFPKEFWLQPAGGEFVMGVFKAQGGGDALFLANHNAYAEQSVTLRLAKAAKLSLFNRVEGRWQPLPIANSAATVPLGPAGGELVRVDD